MPLTELDKSELARNFQLLADLNEPEALLSTLARAAERIAKRELLATISDDEAKRWSIVANALMKAEIEVSAANSPERAKLEAHLREWSGQAPPNPPAAA